MPTAPGCFARSMVLVLGARLYTFRTEKQYIFFVSANLYFKTEEKNHFLLGRHKTPDTKPRPAKTAPRSPHDRSETAPRPPRTVQRLAKNCPRPSQDRQTSIARRSQRNDSNTNTETGTKAAYIQLTCNSRSSAVIIYVFLSDAATGACSTVYAAVQPAVLPSQAAELWCTFRPPRVDVHTVKNCQAAIQNRDWAPPRD